METDKWTPIQKEYRDASYQEDALFTQEIINLICQNSFHVVEIHKHPYINCMNAETDVVLVCKTINKGRKRYIGVELKESDLQKASSQAFLRRNYFDYFYIIINIPISQIIYELTKRGIIKKKIGIISTYHSEPIIVRYSGYTKRINDKLVLSDTYKDRYRRATMLNQRLDYGRRI